MADPEIQKILRTPEVQNALKSLQENPKEATKILSDPNLAPKIAKLVEAGILRMGWLKFIFLQTKIAICPSLFLHTNMIYFNKKTDYFCLISGFLLEI